MVSARFLLSAFLATAYAQQSDDPRVLETVNSSELAETVLRMAPKPAGSSFGIGEAEHDKIAAVLDKTRELVEQARALVDVGGSAGQGEQMMVMANLMLGDVKEHIRRLNSVLAAEPNGEGFLRKKYSDHDVQKAQEDEGRELDITRKVIEIERFIKFPECVGEYVASCMEKINTGLAEEGLGTAEIAVNTKRALTREAAGDNYNKVVIVTNLDGTRVAGHIGDGIVTYPYKWNSINGDLEKGPWNCNENTPSECCTMITTSVPNADIHGNNMECFFYHPLGSVDNPTRDDRVYINNSTDGRVWEIPEVG